MPNGNVLAQLREMADKQKIQQSQAFSLLAAAVADVYEMGEKAATDREAIKKEMRDIHDWMIACRQDIADNKKDIAALEEKSNRWDGIIGIATIIGGVIGSLLGGKN